jgi:RNA polymerase sigma-70 factor (ECF subfamily)
VAAPTLTPTTSPTTRSDTVRFESQVLPLQGRLFARALHLTGARHDAEDLLQDTLLRAFAGFGSYRDGTNLMAWLHRIVNDAWIDAHRTRCRRPPELLVGAPR